jgi:S-DNA-T family DNA segregation ATPase FtsK/SpoIIIE
VEAELSSAEIRFKVRIIEDTLKSFGVPVKVVEVNQGPVITQFGLEPGYLERPERNGKIKKVKIKVNKISALANDLALALAASPIRIEAPIPGRSLVGIEVPNSEISLVSLKSVMATDAFAEIDSTLAIGLGQDVSGQPVVGDLATMPHLLIAGATGSGKSVCINSLIACLLLNNTPDDLNLILVDPKRVELVNFNGIPHILGKVIVEIDQVVGTLKWATREMDRRYRVFSRVGVRNIEGHNQLAIARGEKTLPYIVIFIDELADLMMISPEEVERAVCRIAQLARATGIHLVMATQRPSVDVVTGLIKANFPARISFAVSSQVDARVVLDGPGAEKLLGRGDGLYMASDSSKLVRLQGCFVSDGELRRLVEYWKSQHRESLLSSGQLQQQPLWEDMIAQAQEAERKQVDPLYQDAVDLVREQGRASVSLLQRRLAIGYSRAARLVDRMEADGIVGPYEGPGTLREVLIPRGEEDLQD